MVRRQPGRVARCRSREIDGRVVGVAAHTLLRMVLGGEERLARFSVHATTLPEARGLGIFRELELKHEREAQERGRRRCVLAFASAPTAPIFLGPLGWTEIAGCGSGRGRSSAARRRGGRRGASTFDGRRGVPRGRTTSSVTPQHLHVALPRTRRAATPPSARRRLRGRLAGEAAPRADDRRARRPRRLRRRTGCCWPRRGSSRAHVLFGLPAPEQRGTFLAGRLRPDEPDAALRWASRSRGPLDTDPAALAVHARRHGLLLMRLVFVTQQVDPGHPALAATVPMLRALAERVDEVVVLADRALPEVLPANCRVRRFAARVAGRTRAALRVGARRRARAPAEAGGGGRAHVPDLRGARRAARASARGEGAALVHALAASRGRCGWPSASRTSCSPSTGGRSRSTRRRCARSATGSTSRSSRARTASRAALRPARGRARPLLAGEGPRRRAAGAAARARRRARPAARGLRAGAQPRGARAPRRARAARRGARPRPGA